MYNKRFKSWLKYKIGKCLLNMNFAPFCERIVRDTEKTEENNNYLVEHQICYLQNDILIRLSSTPPTGLEKKLTLRKTLKIIKKNKEKERL